VSELQTVDHDVLVIGAGGAGLRAAIEAASRGVSVGVVCKSLLGKAHTVMAEGGMAAAMGNVWTEDNWQVHFRDTMRGGKMLNNWRMAQLHAQEAPERVYELEDWGALFDRTKDGRILQRDFGGHRYARLAHIGDRTGLELIRTLQHHTMHREVEVHMEVKIVRLLKEGGRVLLEHAKLPKRYWAHAMSHFVYVWNRMAISAWTNATCRADHGRATCATG
jgi:succinate dehydrogenase / fumarate reductase flavoprotein subunit